MHITRTVIALTALIAFAPSGAFAAALYGGATAEANTAPASVGVHVTAGAEATGSASSSAVLDANAAIPSAVITVSSPSEVRSDADLTAFGESLMAADANVAEANASAQGQVTVAYYHPGRLFGIFPVRVKSETDVTTDQNGSVAVATHMPWWNFFVVGTGDTSAQVDETLTSSNGVSTDLKMTTDASARARVIEAIVAAHAAATLAAEASANQ